MAAPPILPARYELLLTALLLVVLPATTGQILRLGYCPSFSALKDFEMDKVSRILKPSYNWAIKIEF